MSTDQQTQLLAEPKEVDVVAIERELASLWKDASDGPADPTSSPVVRACALNFVVVTEEEHDVDLLADMVGEVTIEHPARIFLIAVNRRSGMPKLDAWISARCSLPVPGGKQVCCEQINLLASGTEANKVPSIVTSLLVSDVPSVLLWKAKADSSDNVLLTLSKVVTRVLIDSSDDASPEQALLGWWKFLEKHGTHTTFGDLAWTHLTPWRSIVANAFNPPEMRAQLARIDSLTIEYSSTTAPRHSGLSQAFLFVGWLVRKLHWAKLKPLQRNETGEYVAKFRLDEQAINVHLASVRARTNLPGSIESISIHTNADISLKFSATEHAHCVRFSKQGTASSFDDILTVLSNTNEAALVAQELEVVRRDAGYEAALMTLARVMKL